MLHLLHCSVQVILSLHMPYGHMEFASFLAARTSTSECAPSSMNQAAAVAVHLVKRVDDSVDRTGGEDVRRFRNGRITSRTHEDRRLPWVSPINIGPIPARWNPWWDALLSQERQSQVPLVPLIHGPAEDAIEAQSAAAGPDGREAGSKATELAWLFALTTRKGKKKRFGVTT